jgi:hypothetical protein
MSDKYGFEEHWEKNEHKYHWEDFNAREMCQDTWKQAYTTGQNNREGLVSGVAVKRLLVLATKHVDRNHHDWGEIKTLALDVDAFLYPDSITGSKKKNDFD